MTFLFKTIRVLCTSGHKYEAFFVLILNILFYFTNIFFTSGRSRQPFVQSLRHTQSICFCRQAFTFQNKAAEGTPQPFDLKVFIISPGLLNFRTEINAWISQ